MKTLNLTIIITLIIVTTFSNVFSHDIHDKSDNHHHLKTWKLSSLAKPIEASFLMYKNGEVYLEKADHTTAHFPLDQFEDKDRNELNDKIRTIQSINVISTNENKNVENSSPDMPWISGLFALSSILIILLFAGKKRSGWVLVLFALLLIMSFYSFKSNKMFTMLIGTDPKEIDKAFEPFKPAVNTFWDANYFYVESKGIPNHQMMKGITGWQQQVPIPQCYIGSNAWPIPLNPEIAATPIPVNAQHFLRGAVAIAANGVAIFNPHTNTGVDAKEDGQLDIYGGHCGRADDYHYHIAPLQLHTLGQTAPTNPIAYALDGFAVYGSLEPDGSPMKPLDANHGHFGPDGVYHYHGTVEKPYMIGKMVGKVTEDNTMQIVPQATAKGVRPALTPLQGAVITDCIPKAANNGYTLEYTRSGQKYSVDYTWTTDGKYTFNFISPTGTTTTIYNGFVQCNIPTSSDDMLLSNSLKVFPNPAREIITIDPGDKINSSEIQKITIYTLHGEIMYQKHSFTNTINTRDFATGTYILNVQIGDRQLSKKVIIH